MNGSSIQLFENEVYGQLRVACDEHGDPWFVVSDICSYFGVTNRNRVLQHVDEEDKGGTQMDTPGGKQTLATVNESGLYTILFHIQPTKARSLSEEEIADKYNRVHAFKRWVTHDVLPSIRKHGMYATPQTVEQMLADPDTMIATLQALKAERQKVVALTEDNARMLPKSVAYDAMIDTDGTTTITQVSRYLNQMGTPMTARKLYGLLRADELVCKRDNAPTKKAISKGLAKQVMTVRSDGKQNAPYARLTQKGVDWCVTHYANIPAQMKAM